MGYCTEEQARRFLEVRRASRRRSSRAAYDLKYFLDVSEEEQERRFRQRIDDPLRQWKLSPMDVKSYQRWWDYTRAYDEMIRATDSRTRLGGSCPRMTRSRHASTASVTSWRRSPTSATSSTTEPRQAAEASRRLRGGRNPAQRGARRPVNVADARSRAIRRRPRSGWHGPAGPRASITPLPAAPSSGRIRRRREPRRES